MGDDDAARGEVGGDVAQPAGDVFVRQAVEAVAADTLSVKRARQRDLLREARHGVVERGVVAGDLREIGTRGGDGADRREIVRLVEGASGISAWSAVEERGRDALGLHVVGAAVHDAMADADQRRGVQVVIDEVEQRGEQGFVGGGGVGPALFVECLSARILGDEVRRGANAFHLAVREGLSASAANSANLMLEEPALIVRTASGMGVLVL